MPRRTTRIRIRLDRPGRKRRPYVGVVAAQRVRLSPTACRRLILSTPPLSCVRCRRIYCRTWVVIMNSAHRSKSPVGTSSRQRGSAAPGRRQQAAGEAVRRPGIPTGRVRHDDRGNAVWDWLGDASREALESTSQVLKKLDLPDLQLEAPHHREEHVQGSHRDQGGGYDLYNQTIHSSRRPRNR